MCYQQEQKFLIGLSEIEICQPNSKIHSQIRLQFQFFQKYQDVEST